MSPDNTLAMGTCQSLTFFQWNEQTPTVENGALVDTQQTDDECPHQTGAHSDGNN